MLANSSKWRKFQEFLSAQVSGLLPTNNARNEAFEKDVASKNFLLQIIITYVAIFTSSLLQFLRCNYVK